MSENQTMIEAAEQLAQDRMSHIQRLIDAADKDRQAQEEADRAQKNYAAIWNDVAGKSWTEQELKKIGLKEPSTKRKRAKRTTQTNTTAKPQQSKSSAQANHHEHDASEHSTGQSNDETN